MRRIKIKFTDIAIKGEYKTNPSKYTIENTKLDNSSYKYGYWFETPKTSSDKNVWCTASPNIKFFNTAGGRGDAYGIRPVIEVSKASIDY